MSSVYVLMFSSKGESITFRAHTAAIRWVDLSSDDLRMCTGAADKSVKVSLIAYPFII